MNGKYASFLKYSISEFMYESLLKIQFEKYYFIDSKPFAFIPIFFFERLKFRKIHGCWISLQDNDFNIINSITFEKFVVNYFFIILVVTF